MTKKPYLIRCEDEVHHDLKIFAVKNQLTLGDAIKLLLENYKRSNQSQ